MPTVTIDRSIDVDCAKNKVSERLTQFDRYARFSGVEEIQTRGANRAHVVEVVEGRREEFDLEFIPVPDERIDYQILGDVPMGGSLTLRPRDQRHTELRLHAEYDPQKVSEQYHLDQQELNRRLEERLRNMKSLAEGTD